VGRLRRYAVSAISETQIDGFSFLYRGIPRSFLILLGLYLGVYAGYWAAHLLGGPGDLQQVLIHVLGLLLGITLTITVMKLWPRLEPALPRWFRTEMEAPALHRHHKVLAWVAMLALVLLSTVGVTALVFGAIMIMGLVGGVYILFRMETYILRSLSRVKDRLPWLWAGGGWRVFIALAVVLFLLAAIVTTVAVLVGPTETPGTHEISFLSTLIVLIPAIALVLQATVLGTFIILQLWRYWMNRRQRKGKVYGPRRRALLRTHPSSLAFYIAGVNYATGSFFFMYAVLLVLQSIAEARSRGTDVGIDVSGVLVPGGMLDYIALATFAIAWMALLLNLSGTAVKSGHRLLNRRVFASLSIFFLMVLFMQVIVANGDEFFISIAFRAMYMVGLALAPIFIFWRRWKALASGEGAAPGMTVATPGPVPPPA
jgi:hypothetical protein